MSLKIIKAGIFDTMQDGGRTGFGHLGIPPCGPMDRFSASEANALLGKSLTGPVVEMHFPAPVIEFTAPGIFCVSGADFSAVIDDEPVPLCQPVHVNRGILRFRKPLSGMRCYLSVIPGLKSDQWLGSYCTDLKVNRGGVSGRRLKTGDEICFDGTVSAKDTGRQFLPWNARQNLKTGPVRILQGPEWTWLQEESQQSLTQEVFHITGLSDRMGFRLKGRPLRKKVNEELLSSAVTAGTIQLLPDGNLVVLMADHPTTGGYPRVANVVSADMGRLAQMSPGAEVNFSLTTIQEASELYTSHQAYLSQLKALSEAEMKRFLEKI